MDKIKEFILMLKIHYRNKHGTTNLPWQNAFRKYGKLSLGSIESGSFPKDIDHLHLGGSCKGEYSVKSKNPISPEEIKNIQLQTGCSISVFYGDAYPQKFKFHHNLLDLKIPNLKIYSTGLYGSPMWRSEINWIAPPTDENIFRLVKHKQNKTVLFIGSINDYRKIIINKLIKAGIKVDIIGKGGNISPKFGKELVEFSKNYMISIGMYYDETLPKIRYSSIRLPNSLAMGLVHIEANFDLKNVYNKNEIIQWTNIDNLIDKIKYYQKNVLEGYRIIMRGRQRVIKNWTFSKLAQRFIKEGMKK